MLNPPYGLRFDIYERVQLPEDVPAIAELEEIELYPRIQVITEQEHAALRGHLLLSGVYVGENKEQEGLQHLIPVEITIPLSRVASVEDIAVEIENFDVDLLSTRSLNITGVLSLKGIEGIQTEETSAWSPDEFTVVHNNPSEQGSGTPSIYSGFNPYNRDPNTEANPESFDQNRTNDASPVNPTFYTPYSTPSPAREEAQEERDSWNLPYEALSVDEVFDQQEDFNPEAEAQQEQGQQTSEPREIKETQNAFNAYYATQQEEAGVDDHERSAQEKFYSSTGSYAQDERKSASEPSAEPEVWHFETAGEPSTSQQEEAATPVDEPAEELVAIQRETQEISWEDESALLTADVPQPEAEDEKPELKVAFGSKKTTDSTSASDSYGITSLLQKGKRTEEVLQLEEQIPVEKRDEEQTEDLQWKNLFLGGTSEQTPFKKVKLCIVQREETLETIAGRYQLSTRELQLYNRLSEQSIEEGQVLYIP
ncbi:LysM peptidoglycan-binding domain-containing protein [Paenibacillus sp. Marseille-Q4541]|uniref:LysM peptidoglycan-binding domain-containing protein n=1 Tax=Paenibacillus sp. Marseille-Q4541 TaxID=2831522 RepID=UPI001BA603C7|nr:LysM peptidoglycan-binding domain-containing protein [Paenibacillus sp. Marseille-Q4541]